ncbi:Uncharacterised protein [Actinomyces bovis]|uniref:Phosphodiesterase, MJ0936 family n=1 Tax=Actinomyces bovis TaxID=1658 RepID=A0ABY1VNA7_9ACTO|nr:serine/threonine protein phosphatase [Actinomyces bovis]SPT52543.1 Uncharacterised protein [Actinomyces bovis]VEG54300.1 Uncharacterised protein [Actinomyces israelii]
MEQQDNPSKQPFRLRRWWLSRSVRFRKAVRTSGLLFAVALVSLALGISTAKAESPVGPHTASWRTTLNSTLTMDLGPLGSASYPSPAGPFGVEVRLGEVPAQLGVTNLESASLTELLSGDAASYGTLLSNPELTVLAGLEALLGDGLRRAGAIGACILCLIAAGRLLTRGHLRDSASKLLTQPAPVVLAVSTVVLGGGSILVPALSSHEYQGQRLEVLAGTDFADARISGRVADIVQTYGGQIHSKIESNSAFYEQAQANLRTAWEQAEKQTKPAFLQGSGLTVAIMTTDLHCNLDVIAFTGVLHELAGAKIHLDDGDLTMSGTSPENICGNALDKAVPKGVKKAYTRGNHDSETTEKHMASLGWTVSDGTVQEVDGLRVLGDADVYRTTTSGTTQVGEEDSTALGERLAATSCKPGADVDLVLIHEPYTFEPLVRQGCAPLLLAGHVHKEHGLSATISTNSRTGTVAQLISGAGKGGTSLGAVTEDAFMHLLAFDSKGTLLAWRTVTLHPDASVTVSNWEKPPTAAQAKPHPTATPNAGSTPTSSATSSATPTAAGNHSTPSASPADTPSVALAPSSSATPSPGNSR